MRSSGRSKCCLTCCQARTANNSRRRKAVDAERDLTEPRHQQKPPHLLLPALSFVCRLHSSGSDGPRSSRFLVRASPTNRPRGQTLFEIPPLSTKRQPNLVGFSAASTAPSGESLTIVRDSLYSV